MNDIFYAIDRFSIPHKIQILVLLLILVFVVRCMYVTIRDWWCEYKQQTNGIEEWEEEQHNNRIDFAIYNGNGKVVNLDEHIKREADEIRKVTEGRG